MVQRGHVLHAALKEFTAHGYRRSTLEKVANEAGPGKTALYLPRVRGTGIL